LALVVVTDKLANVLIILPYTGDEYCLAPYNRLVVNVPILTLILCTLKIFCIILLNPAANVNRILLKAPRILSVIDKLLQDIEQFSINVVKLPLLFVISPAHPPLVTLDVGAALLRALLISRVVHDMRVFLTPHIGLAATGTANKVPTIPPTLKVFGAKFWRSN
jgi:hypothetical protein